MKLLVYLIKRILYILPILIGLIIIGFLLFYLIPADPVRLIAGPYASPEQILKVKQEYGLDQPLYMQFVKYIVRFFQGDLGKSIYTNRPVLQELISRSAATLELGLISMFGASVLGVIVGIFVALRRNSFADHVFRAITIAGLAIASFWLAILLQLSMGYNLDIFPIGGRIAPGLSPKNITGFYLLDSLFTLNMQSFGNSLMHLILPAITLALPCFATIVRFVRGGVLDALQSDYVFYEKAMGLSHKILIYKYILRNAIIVPIVQIGLLIGYTIAGTIVVEKVFSWPGIGSFAATSIVMFDYNAVIGVTVWSGMAFCFGTLMADVALAFIDPREIKNA